MTSTMTDFNSIESYSIISGKMEKRTDFQAPTETQPHLIPLLQFSHGAHGGGWHGIRSSSSYFWQQLFKQRPDGGRNQSDKLFGRVGKGIGEENMRVKVLSFKAELSFLRFRRFRHGTKKLCPKETGKRFLN